MVATASRPRATFEDPLSLIPRAMTKLYSLWVSATYPFASVGGNLSIHYTAQMSRRMASRIKLGDSLMIRKDAWLNVVREADDEPKIIIEDGCLIGARSVISAKNLIHIERDVILATQVLIMDHNHAMTALVFPLRPQGATPGGTFQ